MIVRAANKFVIMIVAASAALVAPVLVCAQSDEEAGAVGSNSASITLANVGGVGHPSDTELPGVETAMSPLDALRVNVERGISILNDPTFTDPSSKSHQRTRLCGLLLESFDARLFSKLALGKNWDNFGAQGQDEFVDAFVSRLCTVHLERLQDGYSDETVTFVRERIKDQSTALVTVEIYHQKMRIPIMVRMARRNNRWVAFDAIILGVSSLKLYREELSAALNTEMPADVIRNLRASISYQE